jgi:hypothetical protein
MVDESPRPNWNVFCVTLPACSPRVTQGGPSRRGGGQSQTVARSPRQNETRSDRRLWPGSSQPKSLGTSAYRCPPCDRLGLIPIEPARRWVRQRVAHHRLRIGEKTRIIEQRRLRARTAPSLACMGMSDSLREPVEGCGACAFIRTYARVRAYAVNQPPRPSTRLGRGLGRARTARVGNRLDGRFGSGQRTFCDVRERLRAPHSGHEARW